MQSSKSEQLNLLSTVLTVSLPPNLSLPQNPNLLKTDIRSGDKSTHVCLDKFLHYISIPLDFLAKRSVCMCVVTKDYDQHFGEFVYHFRFWFFKYGSWLYCWISVMLTFKLYIRQFWFEGCSRTPMNTFRYCGYYVDHQTVFHIASSAVNIELQCSSKVSEKPLLVEYGSYNISQRKMDFIFFNPSLYFRPAKQHFWGLVGLNWVHGGNSLLGFCFFSFLILPSQVTSKQRAFFSSSRLCS